ncbi:ATP-binding protein [Nitrincola nitratireducens]|uniref:histidine kinase n=1 Tax=Nitrincola nitratireducens TaxID=1229521 RepID=W9VRD4_9GAMM|nr:ATP-binding protein [Nitrincola nitratireducens]EXJ12965.1 Nitrate/nitrite sensor protein narX [Nitrincola nitratireducens]
MPFEISAKWNVIKSAWGRSQSEDKPQHPWLVDLPLGLLRHVNLDEALAVWLEGLEVQLKSSGATLMLQTEKTLTKVGREGLCHPHLNCPYLSPQGDWPDVGELNTCIPCIRMGKHRLACGVRDGHGGQGVLVMEFLHSPRTAQKRQLREVGKVLSETLSLVLDERQRREAALMEERALLSRELHDSVAQELSYLQIRMSRLASVIENPEQAAEASHMLKDLRHNVQRAHRQVRELISLSRLTLEGRSLHMALEAAVDEFSRQSRCVFELDNRLPVGCMRAETELQVMHILREALVNVVRHSHAQHVLITLKMLKDQRFEVCVEDDGVGLSEDAEKQEGHFGLKMMRERANTIPAQLSIESKATRGTRVKLLWRAL